MKKNLKTNHTMESAFTIQKQIEPICPLLSKRLSNKDHRQLRLKQPKVPCLLTKLFYHLNGGIAHLKSFPGSKAKQMDHHVIPILEEHQYGAAVIHVGIKDLLKNRTNINVSEIAKDIINIAFRCRSHSIATIFISSIAYSTKVSHMIIQKLNELMLNKCTKYDFHLVDNGTVSKENM